MKKQAIGIWGGETYKYQENHGYQKAEAGNEDPSLSCFRGSLEVDFLSFCYCAFGSSILS